MIAFHEEVGLFFPTIVGKSLFRNKISAALEPDHLCKGQVFRLGLPPLAERQRTAKTKRVER
jgi:hypothetical protein